MPVMKELFFINIILFLCIGTATSQVAEDTVYIQFNSKTDFVKEANGGEKTVWLKNYLYDKELSSYNRLLKKYENDTLQPPPAFPAKPVRYYKYFILKETKRCEDSLSTKLEDDKLNYLSRNKLKQLTPHHKEIFIIKKKKKSYMCYKVSFYENVVE